VPACVEGERELGAVAGLQERVAGGGGQAALEEGDPLDARPGGQVAGSECLVHVGSLAGADPCGHRGLELLNRLLMLAFCGGVDAEGGACPPAARAARLRGRELAQRPLRFAVLVPAEAELELSCGELVLALEGERDLAPGLQVLERDRELVGEHAQPPAGWGCVGRPRCG
jgi:hypothetical protein